MGSYVGARLVTPICRDSDRNGSRLFRWTWATGCWPRHQSLSIARRVCLGS